MGSICFPEVSTDMVPSLMTSLQSLSPTSAIHTASIVVGSKCNTIALDISCCERLD